MARSTYNREKTISRQTRFRLFFVFVHSILFESTQSDDGKERNANGNWRTNSKKEKKMKKIVVIRLTTYIGGGGGDGEEYIGGSIHSTFAQRFCLALVSVGYFAEIKTKNVGWMTVDDDERNERLKLKSD